MPSTEVLKASQIDELCLRILERRKPGTIKAYENELSKYERDLARGGHKETTVAYSSSSGLLSTRQETLGFAYIGKDGQPKVTPRPHKPTPRAYGRTTYWRSGSYTNHAENIGLLAGSQFNRDIRPDRVEQYGAEMEAGRWRDLLSDPISITADGQVLNGQHRIAAAYGVDWSKVTNDPAFLVVWDVEPTEAQFADGSRRTARDEKVIADKLIAVLS